jgi:cardiolipin synthase (CMP-forming)
LSLSRLPLAVAFALTVGHPRWAIAVLVLAGASDVLDGWVARRFGHATPTGAVLDATMDKVFVGVVVVALVLSHALTLGQAVLLGVRDIGELLIGTRLVAGDGSTLTRPHAPHVLGKVTTCLQYVVALAAVVRSRHVPSLVAAAAVTGALASAAYWAREHRALRSADGGRER